MMNLTFKNNPLIQIVDDDATSRLLMRATLEKEGFRVIESTCGRDAITAFETQKPDVTLLDVVMPGMDGFETCSTLRTMPDGEDIPILLVSGLDDERSIEKAFQVGATDFITKPLRWPVLSHRIRYMLQASKALREVKKKKEQIQHLAFYDHLTGLANRSLFKTTLHKALSDSEENQKQLAVLFLDLDRFKRINDTLGHHIGDLLLKSIAERINNCIRETDAFTRLNEDEAGNCVSRLGGDEFTILLTNLDRPDNAEKIARRIIESIRQPFNLEGHEVHITVSIGISTFPQDGQSVDILMKNADTAMYHAKESGRNRLQFYQEKLDTTTAERLLLEGDLKNALGNGEFLLHYQPQFSPYSEQIIGVEALLRWQHPTRGFLLPIDFLSVAEELGHMPVLTDWIFREACRQLLAWQDSGLPPVTISINLSGHQFCNQRIPEKIVSILREFQIAPGSLEVELTENTIRENCEDAKTILQKLKNLGIKIVLDDFGTGFSSLAHLRHLPIDSLKIDRSFVKEISSDPNDTAVIRAIVSMAHSLNLKVIAGGVETVEQLNFLSKVGCERLQGLLFSQPLPADALFKQAQEKLAPASA